MTYNHSEQTVKNQQALDNPQVGDYWNEMFCPYFVVVEVLKDGRFRVLSCMGGPNNYNRKDEPNARKDNDDNTWSFDYSKDMVVGREWMSKAVKYGSIDGFVADVWNTEKTQKIATEWRNYHANKLRKEYEAKKAEWEQFTGWKYLQEA